MLRIGLTGGIGSGKSTVADLFAERGAAIIDCDEIAHTLTTNGGPIVEQIVTRFGADVRGTGQTIDRAALRERVFADADMRAALEAILHPPIIAELDRRCRCANAAYAVLVVPLLIEKRLMHLCDRILVVHADAAIRRRRVMERDDLDPDIVDRIMASQASDAERLALADDVITNETTLTALREQVDAVHRHYLELAKRQTEH